MNHDDGNHQRSWKVRYCIVVLVEQTPTSIYLANKGYKTSNIPLINENSIPKILQNNPKLLSNWSKYRT